MDDTIKDIRFHLSAIDELLEQMEPPPPANVTAIKKPNEVELEGRIGRPQIKTVRGKELFTAGLGINEGNVTRWHNLVGWGSIAQDASTLTSGQIVRVIGVEKEVMYVDSNGVTRTKREITASSIESVGSVGLVNIS